MAFLLSANLSLFIRTPHRSGSFHSAILAPSLPWWRQHFSFTLIFALWYFHGAVPFSCLISDTGSGVYLIVLCVYIYIYIFILASFQIFLYHWCSAIGFWYVLVQFSFCLSFLPFFFLLHSWMYRSKISSSVENLWEFFFLISVCIFSFSYSYYMCVQRLNIFPQANKTAFFFPSQSFSFCASIWSCGFFYYVFVVTYLLFL